MRAVELELPLPNPEYAAVLPPCPSCGRPMHLALSGCRPDGSAEACVFKCGECGVWTSGSAAERRVA